jgi:hypothetical protein
MKPSSKLSEAIAVTAELTGTILSKVAAQVMLDDLSRYPEHQVMGALTRCRRELKGRLTIADVISRLDDGRPGVEEAWAMVPKGESDTVVWTEEMSQAMSVTHDLLDCGDDVGARMAFKEMYQKLCQSARDRNIPVSWSVSLGWDTQGREPAIRKAIERGQLTCDQAKLYLPYFSAPANEVPLIAKAVSALSNRLTHKISLERLGETE